MWWNFLSKVNLIYLWMANWRGVQNNKKGQNIHLNILTWGWHKMWNWKRIKWILFVYAWRRSCFSHPVIYCFSYKTGFSLSRTYMHNTAIRQDRVPRVDLNINFKCHAIIFTDCIYWSMKFCLYVDTKI